MRSDDHNHRRSSPPLLLLPSPEMPPPFHSARADIGQTSMLVHLPSSLSLCDILLL